MAKQTAWQENLAEQLSFEWSHFKISSTNSKVRRREGGGGAQILNNSPKELKMKNFKILLKSITVYAQNQGFLDI